jgi:hypothetical protein
LWFEIVKRSDDLKGFTVLPRRWVVANFSWLGRNRRIVKVYGNNAKTHCNPPRRTTLNKVNIPNSSTA